jgi:hypothetical protein
MAGKLRPADIEATTATGREYRLQDGDGLMLKVSPLARARGFTVTSYSAAAAAWAWAAGHW